MKNKFFFSFTFVLILISAASCSTKKLPVKNIEITKSNGEKIYVKAEVAKTAKDRETGFMFRKKIPDGTGMIFVFDDEDIRVFWMKNTYVDLSIAYIDHNGLIRDIFDMKSESLASVASTTSVTYALEVPKGWFKKNGISAGDRLTLPQAF